jgi:hypothetical protein
MAMGVPVVQRRAAAGVDVVVEHLLTASDASAMPTPSNDCSRRPRNAIDWRGQGGSVLEPSQLVGSMRRVDELIGGVMIRERVG